MTIEYAAGFIDAEGSISIKPRYRHLSVVNTHLKTLRFLQESFNCGSIKPKRISAMGKKPIWRWRVYNRRDLLRVMHAIEPFLIQKKKKANSLIKLLES